MKLNSPILGLLACSVALQSASADSLTLTLATPLDISALAIGACGDLAFQASSNRLWIADGLVNGQLHQVNSTTGASLITIDPGAIPGLDQGPDALAVGSPTFGSNLFVFSPFAEAEGGRLNSAGTLIADYATSHAATGADFDNDGRLWVVSGLIAGGGSQLRRIAIGDGALLQTVPINPALTTRMVDVAFDPHTGACYVLTETSNSLLEIDLNTGNVVSNTDVSSFLINGNSIVGGFDFDATGARIFLCTGAGAGADTVVVLSRNFAPTVCTGDVIGLPCPCGNVGALGRGCENSFATGGGLLGSTGVPRVSTDTFRLDVLGLPPVTTALFFQGTTIPPEIFTFGDGIRCVQGSVIRLGIKSTSAGAAAYPQPGDPTISVRGSIPPAGATRFYQAWYRNVAAFCTPAGFNLTNANKVIWAP